MRSSTFEITSIKTELTKQVVEKCLSRKTKISIHGMTCTSCSGTVEDLLQHKSGVLSARVTLATNCADVEYNPNLVAAQELVEDIESIGFEAEVLRDDEFDNCVGDGSFEFGKSDVEMASVRKHIILLVESTVPHSSYDHGATPTPVFVSSRSNSNSNRKFSSDMIQRVEYLLRSLTGVHSAQVNKRDQDADMIAVEFDDTVTGPRIFCTVLAKRMGVNVSVCLHGGFLLAEKMSQQQRRETKAHLKALAVAAVLSFPILVIGMLVPMSTDDRDHSALHYQVVPGLDVYSIILFALCTPVQFGVGMRFHKKAFQSVRNGTLGMDFLVSTGTCASYLYSAIGLIRGLVMRTPRDSDVMYFETSAVLITVVLLGKFLETYARGVTASAIQGLSALRARSARLVTPAHISPDQEDLSLDEGDELYGDRINPLLSQHELNAEASQVIDSSLVHRGDVLRLVAGETVPADGLLMGPLGLDESLMTGESRVVSKKSGDVVYGGTVVVEGSTLMTVTACGDDSVLGKIVSTVQEAQASKPPIQELADKISRYFVPVIAIISLLTFLVWMFAWLAGAVPREWYDTSPSTTSDDSGKFFLFASLFSLAVWVSACPCAFGLATPTAVLVATGVAAKLGVLIRKGAALQHAATVNIVAFDKTGTLTEGKPKVSDFYMVVRRKAMSPLSSDRSESIVNCTRHRSPATDTRSRDRESDSVMVLLLRMLFAAEVRSSHPLSKGLVEFSRKKLEEYGSAAASIGPTLSNDTALLTTSADGVNEADRHLEVVPGQGIRLSLSLSAAAARDVAESLSLPSPSIPRVSKSSDDSASEAHVVTVLVGSPSLMEEGQVALSDEVIHLSESLRTGGKVVVYLAVHGHLCAVIGITDSIRPEAAATIASLQSRGLLCCMITGDERNTALAIGGALGIPSSLIFAGMKPDDKEAAIIKLQGTSSRSGTKRRGVVAFVGDGCNDSQALARADVGMAMAGGTSIAVEAGDMILCKDDISAVLVALDISKKTLRRIKMNYFWAFGYNALLIPLSAGVLYPAYGFAVPPMYSGLAMAASSISIVLSSLTLLLYRAPQESSWQRITKDLDLDPNLCQCPASSVSDLGGFPDSRLRALTKMIRYLYERGAKHCRSIMGMFSPHADEWSSLSLEEVQLTTLDDTRSNHSTTSAAVDFQSRGESKSCRNNRGCGCGKGNCKCGDSCQCGISL